MNSFQRHSIEAYSSSLSSLAISVPEPVYNQSEEELHCSAKVCMHVRVHTNKCQNTAFCVCFLPIIIRQYWLKAAIIKYIILCTTASVVLVAIATVCVQSTPILVPDSSSSFSTPGSTGRDLLLSVWKTYSPMVASPLF